MNRFELGDKLAEAAETGTADDVMRWLAAGADPDHRHDGHEWTPLMYAADRGDLAMVRALVEAGADPKEVTADPQSVSAIELAMAANHPAVVAYLRPVSDDPDAPPVPPAGAFTELMTAAAFGDVEKAKQLLAIGADLHATDGSGATPLYAAAEVGRLEMVKFLLSIGATVNQARKSGTTPLHIAMDHPPVALVLIEAGADVNARDAEGRSPLHRAVRRGNRAIEVVKALLARGADQTILDNTGRTARQWTKNSALLALLK